MALNPMHQHITGSIVDASMMLHRDLGPSMFESTYEAFLVDELERRGHAVDRQLLVSATYRGRTIEQAYRLDLLVDNVVIVELKCTERVLPIHKRQVLSYLRLMQLNVGLVLNFGLETMKEGISRVFNDTMLP